MKEERKEWKKAGRKEGRKQGDGCLKIPAPVDSILEAVLTVSPKRQYLGILDPTTPATTGPD